MPNLQGFDARNVEPMEEFEPIPAGQYLAAIVGSEIKETKAGDGSYLELTFQVLEGEYKGRLLWSRLNLDNPNKLAVKIARSQLAAICKAVGVLTPNDSTELHNLPLMVKVGLKRREDTDEMTNEIKGYSKKSSPGQASQAQSDTPPWRRSSNGASSSGQARG
jgi:hypothetical protein